MIDTIAQGAVMGLVNGAVNQHFTDENRQKDFENWEIGRRQNYADSQRAQIAAPYNTKIGMMLAGLNPVTMTTPSAATPAATPQGTRQNNPVDVAATTQMMADARLKESEAEKIDLQNEITRGKNEAAQNTYLEWSGNLVDILRKNGFSSAADTVENDVDDILKNGSKINVGHMQGAIEAFRTYDAMQQRIFDTLDKLFSTKEVLEKLNNNSAHELAQMPRLQRELTEKYIASQVSLAAYLASGADVNEERIAEIRKNVERMDGEINLMVQQGKLSKAQAEQIRNSDWKSLLYDGEVGKAAVAGGEKAVGQVLELVPSVVGARGLVKAGSKIGSTVVNGQSKTVSNKVAKTITSKNVGKPPVDLRQRNSKTYVDFDNLYKRNIPEKKHVIKMKKKFDDIVDSLEFSNPDW